MKKRIISLSVLGVLLLALVIVYFAVIAPATRPAEKEDAAPPVLLEGESLGANNRIFLYPEITKDDVNEIRIHNPLSDYTFYHAKDGNFYIKGSKNTPYDTSAFETQILACSRYALAVQRVSENESDLAKFGLDKENTYYEISNKTGDKYKVYIGDKIVTGGGFYCRAEGRNAVYIMDTGYEAFIKDERDILSPLLSLQMSENDYYTCQSCCIWRNGEKFIDVDFQTADDRALNGTSSQYFMNYPEGYAPSTTKYQEILQSLSNFEGKKVLEFGNADEILPAETLEKYGLTNPYYLVSYVYNGVENLVMLSEKNEDGDYYAYSVLFNTVVLIGPDKAGFVDWDIMLLIDRPIFQVSILNLDSLEIDSFDGKGVRKFTPVAGKDNLESLFGPDGQKYSDEQATNFKRLYQKMLEIKLEDHTDSDSTDDEILYFKASAKTGQVYEYRFYAYTTRRCYFTINGKGEFYCLRDSVELVRNNLARFEAGEEIDVFSKN